MSDKISISKLREAVLDEARSWIRTPFMWNGCIKGTGVDCGRILAASLQVGGAKQIDLAALPHLPPQWFLHKESGLYLDLVRRFATEYRLTPAAIREVWGGPTKSRPEPADIVVAKVGRDWAHAAFVVAWPRILGAVPGFCVAEWRDIHSCPHFVNRELKFFDPFEVSA
jgi:hypothetical protein